MRAEADHRRVGLEECGVLQSAAFARRQVQRRHYNSLYNFPKSFSDVVAFAVNDVAVFKDKVLGVRFDLEIVSHHPRDLLLQDAAGRRYGAYRVGASASADCPGPKRRDASISVRDRYVIRVDTKFLSHDLRHTRFVPLPSRRIALKDLHFAAGVEADGCGTVAGLILHRNENRRRNAGQFGSDTESDADIATAPPSFALFASEFF